jgi:hypothetical protein
MPKDKFSVCSRCHNIVPKEAHRCPSQWRVWFSDEDMEFPENEALVLHADSIINAAEKATRRIDVDYLWRMREEEGGLPITVTVCMKAVCDPTTTYICDVIIDGILKYACISTKSIPG